MANIVPAGALTDAPASVAVLDLPGFRLTRTALLPTGAPTWDEWAACGEVLREIEASVHWWIGDWLNYGERRWGETYAQAVEATGYSQGTLANDKWVAARVDSSRRRENLPFAHHQEVAKLEPQTQAAVLDQAEREGWPRERVRQEVRLQALRARAGDTGETDMGITGITPYQTNQDLIFWRRRHGLQGDMNTLGGLIIECLGADPVALVLYRIGLEDQLDRDGEVVLSHGSHRAVKALANRAHLPALAVASLRGMTQWHVAALNDAAFIVLGQPQVRMNEAEFAALQYRLRGLDVPTAPDIPAWRREREAVHG